MVVGNKSDGGQTQESDGGNTICTSSRGKSIIVKKSITKQREKYYCKKYHKAEKKVLLLKISIITIVTCTSSREKGIIVKKKYYQADRKVLL